MSALQFIPKAEAWPGDRVREVERNTSIDHMPLVVRLDGGTGVYVRDETGERFLSLSRVDAVLRVITVSR